MRAVKILLVSLFSAVVIGCRSYETNTVDRRSASTSSSVLADSIVVHDSIIIRQTPDTVYYTKYRTLYKERLRRDTLFRCDTVFVSQTVKEEANTRRVALWWLLLPLAVAVMWKIGLFDLLRKLIFKKIDTNA